jgi:hypothetical protein
VAKARRRKRIAANLGFEAKLWLAADKMRNNLDTAEYKHVVLGLIFLKWVPKGARKPQLQASAKQPTIGKLIDDAMVAIDSRRFCRRNTQDPRWTSKGSWWPARGCVAMAHCSH